MREPKIRQGPGRSFLRAATCAIAVLAVLGLGACGEEEEAAQLPSLTFAIAESGQLTKVGGPDILDPGLVEVTLKNESESEGDLQLIRTDGDHSAEEAIEGLDRAMKGEGFRKWFFPSAGVGPTASGEAQTVTQDLRPGAYYAFDTESDQSPPDPALVPGLEVRGHPSNATPSTTVEADETIGAYEYGFYTEQLSSGRNEIAFDNLGSQPHHLVVARLTGDGTGEDVERAFESEKGKPPFEEEGIQSTAVLERGDSQLVTLDLKPGRYVLFCFVTDREGGQPHALKGMVTEVEVE